MKLFTVGPVEMYPQTLEDSSRQLPYFRNAEFSTVTLESEQMLVHLADAPEGSKAVFLTCSGTGAMEASVINCLNNTDYVLTINGGSFGHRFEELCNRHGIRQEVLKLNFGEKLTKEKLDAAYRPGMTALLINVHETSVGQLYDMEIVGAFCKEKNLFLIADAISSFLADQISMERMCIDALIISSQKALALAPGLSAIILSPRAVEMVEQKGTSVLYFDLRDYLKNGIRGQQPYTPAVGIMLTLHSRLKVLTEQGLENVRNDIQSLAQHFRNGVADLPIQIPDFPHSNALTPLYFPEGNAKSVYERLKNEYALTVTPNGGELADYVLRVGHIGNLNIEDIEHLLFAMHEIFSIKES